MQKRKRKGIFSTLMRGIAMFMFAFLMVLFGLPWLLLGKTRQVKPMPPATMPRRVWTQNERAEWVAGHRDIAA